jgi:hypothetical protein
MKSIALAALTLALSAHAAATTSFVDQRAYERCEATVGKTYSEAGLDLSTTFFLKRTDNDRIYYLNGFVQRDNAREPLTATCVTSRNGLRVLDMETTVGTHISIEELASL